MTPTILDPGIGFRTQRPFSCQGCPGYLRWSGRFAKEEFPPFSPNQLIKSGIGSTIETRLLIPVISYSDFRFYGIFFFPSRLSRLERSLSVLWIVWTHCFLLKKWTQWLDFSGVLGFCMSLTLKSRLANYWENRFALYDENFVPEFWKQLRRQMNKYLGI